MKKIIDWQLVLGLFLLLLSAGVYFVQFIVFKDARNEAFYFMQDTAFLFVQALLAMLVINKILNYRERQNILKKLNMVIGAFFSETGTELLKLFSSFDRESANIVEHLVITNDWSKKDFYKMYKHVKTHQGSIDFEPAGLKELKNLLVSKRDFLLRLLENPNLMEHETFTDLLWAVFHLTEELEQRKSLENLAVKDKEHLKNDIKRAYILMISQWLSHMEHLKKDYPYLFSLALRTSPFDKNASAEIK
jgi:hypothetical protein